MPAAFLSRFVRRAAEYHQDLGGGRSASGRERYETDEPACAHTAQARPRRAPLAGDAGAGRLRLSPLTAALAATCPPEELAFSHVSDDLPDRIPIRQIIAHVAECQLLGRTRRSQRGREWA